MQVWLPPRAPGARNRSGEPSRARVDRSELSRLDRGRARVPRTDQGWTSARYRSRRARHVCPRGNGGGSDVVQIVRVRRAVRPKCGPVTGALSVAAWVAEGLARRWDRLFGGGGHEG